MIWLSGILSQGGKKFTWARYSLVYVLQRENLGVKSYAQTDSTMSCYEGYSINQSNGLITLNDKHNWGGGVGVGDVLYNTKEELEYDYGSVSNLEYAYEHVVLTRDISGTYPAYTYQCYKITTILDKEFLDTVESSDPNAYPVEGRQGDYWYVKYSDTPITWERYAMTEGEVQGESVTQSFTSGTYLYRATSYSRNGKAFTATGTKTRASSLAVNNYLIQNNGAFVNSTSMSGDTLFKITKKSGYSSVSITFDTFTIGDVKGSYIDTVTSYNPVEYPDDGAQDGYWYVKV